MSDEQAPEPQPVEFVTQAPHGGSQDYGSDWVRYALDTAVPDHVQGVDHALNPTFGGSGDDTTTAYA